MGFKISRRIETEREIHYYISNEDDEKIRVTDRVFVSGIKVIYNKLTKQYTIMAPILDFKNINRTLHTEIEKFIEEEIKGEMK